MMWTVSLLRMLIMKTEKWGYLLQILQAFINQFIPPFDHIHQLEQNGVLLVVQEQKRDASKVGAREP